MIVCNIICFVIIGFLVWKIFQMKKNTVIESISDKNYILEKPKQLPEFSDYDKDLTVLKDVIESAKLEMWDVKIETESAGGRRECYEITLDSPNKSLEFFCRLYVDHDNDRKNQTPPRLYTTRIRKYVDPNNKYGQGYYTADLSNNDKAKYLVLNFVWKYILDKHQAEYDEHIARYADVKSAIEKELKTLNRDRQLRKLIEI